MIEYPDLIDPQSPSGLRVRQVTDDPKGASLVYPDLPSFLPDGKRFIILTSDGPAICDLEAGGRLEPLFDADPPKGIRFSLDGQYGYFAKTSDEGDGQLTISRVNVDDRRVEEVFHAEGVLPNVDLPAHGFGMRTVSMDNLRVAGTMTRGDGRSPEGRRCVVAIDLSSREVRPVVEDHDFTNPHLQYCRSEDPEGWHDLLIQMNHGAYLDPRTDKFVGLGPPSDKGVDVHAFRDDGTDWRDLPFGRDGIESCIGHQIWRGKGRSVVTVTLQNLDTTYGWGDGSAQEAIAGWPIPASQDGPHAGLLTPGARRVVLSEGFDRPRFCHLDCDDSGLRFCFDTFPIFDGERAGMQLLIGSAGDLESPLDIAYLLNTRVTFNKPGGYHAHPIVSPDGSTVLFNSDITGLPQVYWVTGWSW